MLHIRRMCFKSVNNSQTIKKTRNIARTWNASNRYLEPFRRGSRVWRTDGQTDRMAFSNSVR